MKSHTTSRSAPSAAWPGVRPLTNVLRFVGDRFLWMPIGVLVAIAWANLAHFPSTTPSSSR